MPGVDAIMAAQRAESFAKRSIKSTSTLCRRGWLIGQARRAIETTS